MIYPIDIRIIFIQTDHVSSMGDKDESRMENKYIVPEGMLKAALSNQPYDEQTLQVERERLELAIKWLSEHPIVPSENQALQLTGTLHTVSNLVRGTQRAIAEWQRVMFRAPRPEIPEGIEDLVYSAQNIAGVGIYPQYAQPLLEESDRRVLAAYRRGQKSVSGGNKG